MAEEIFTRIWLSSGADLTVKMPSADVKLAIDAGLDGGSGTWLPGLEGHPTFLSEEACSKLLVLLEHRRDLELEKQTKLQQELAMARAAGAVPILTPASN